MANAIEAGHVGGAALDVFETEPPADWRLAQLPQVVATPHIAASTLEAQEQVGIETAIAVRDYLRDGAIRNAVNFTTGSGEDAARVQPFVRLAERMGTFLSQSGGGRIHAVGLRYYGPLASAHADLLASAAVAGVLRPLLSSAVTVVNARQVAAGRGIEIIESRSSRPRDFANMISLKLHTTEGERWIEGAIFEPDQPRLTLLDAVEVEAPLAGLLLVIRNEDQPGVIGEIGTILGRHAVNIASFALGRGPAGAVGVVTLDQDTGSEAGLSAATEELRALPAIRDVRLVRL